ncbi:hypothetical protein ACOMHN_035642 [Nucella lapillus]
MKHNRGPKLLSVDTELLNWFAAIRSQNIPVDGHMLKMKAEELAATCSMTDWKCSDGKAVVYKLLAHVNAGTSAKDFKPSLLDAVCVLKQSWDKITPATIANSFEWNIDPSKYVSVDDDVATEEPATCASALSTSTDTVDEEASDEEDNCGKGLERISTNSALDCVEKLKKFCLQSGCSDDIMSPFNEFSDLLEKAHCKP